MEPRVLASVRRCSRRPAAPDKTTRRASATPPLRTAACRQRLLRLRRQRERTLPTADGPRTRRSLQERERRRERVVGRAAQRADSSRKGAKARVRRRPATPRRPEGWRDARESDGRECGHGSTWEWRLESCPEPQNKAASSTSMCAKRCARSPAAAARPRRFRRRGRSRSTAAAAAGEPPFGTAGCRARRAT